MARSLPVADLSGIRAAFHPGIEVTKSATPTIWRVARSSTPTPSGTPATFRCRVWPARITDDTCSAVTYASGDEDNDGLLDTINSIFEDALATRPGRSRHHHRQRDHDQHRRRQWLGRWTPGGAPLCGQRQDPSRVFRTCNVRDTDEATVSVSAVAVEGVRVGVGDLAGTGAPGLLGLMLTLGGLLVLARRHPGDLRAAAYGGGLDRPDR